MFKVFFHNCVDYFYHVSTKQIYNKTIEETKLTPLSYKNIRHRLWDYNTRKIILMSATFNHLDVERLGLNERNCKYIFTSSPIPAKNRPFIVDKTAKMVYGQYDAGLEKISAKIKEIIARHAGKKGLIHTTYTLAEALKNKLSEFNNILIHTPETRLDTYKDFLASKDGILIGCGLSEGIDLAGFDYGWQVITKIQWPSLGDAYMKYLSTNIPERYTWEAIRTIIQQYGRICRTPTDYGVTYMLDSGFESLYKRAACLFPKYFQEAVEWRN